MVLVTDPFTAFFNQEFDKVIAKQGINRLPDNYPPHNIIKIDEDEFVMEFAVAGFTKDDIEVTTHKRILSVTGEQKEKELAEGSAYIHKGIATRKFVRTFTLPEYTEVLKAKVEDGILSITLVRSIPEEQKPKTITIK
jgi:molecular chaperone IbpA